MGKCVSGSYLGTDRGWRRCVPHSEAHLTDVAALLNVRRSSVCYRRQRHNECVRMRWERRTQEERRRKAALHPVRSSLIVGGLTGVGTLVYVQLTWRPGWASASIGATIALAGVAGVVYRDLKRT